MGANWVENIRRGKMILYKMELIKILKRKSTWVLIGTLLLLVVALFGIEANNAQGMAIEFGQFAGYRRFLDLTELFIVCALIVEIIILAPFYCEDKQNNVDVLLSTTTKGKITDFIARIQVTFTVIINTQVIIIVATFLICFILYGYPDSTLTMKEMNISTPLLAETSLFMFISSYLFNVFTASIMLGALIICISTMSKKTMYSLIVIVGVVLLPAMLEDVFKNGNMNIGYIFITAQPIMLSVSRCLVESWPVYGWHILMVFFISIFVICISGKKWCSVPKE